MNSIKSAETLLVNIPVGHVHMWTVTPYKALFGIIFYWYVFLFLQETYAVGTPQNRLYEGASNEYHSLWNNKNKCIRDI